MLIEVLQEIVLIVAFKGPLPDRAMGGRGKRLERGNQPIDVAHTEGLNLSSGQPEELGQMKQPPGVTA